MRRDTITLGVGTSFLSFEKDVETMLRKIFIESQPYTEELIRLLTINTKDCLTNRTNQAYIDKVKSMTLPKLKEQEYIRLSPRLEFGEHEEVKSYILISFDNFTPNKSNPQFRDCTVNFDILCFTECWDLENYGSRPLKICGFIDGILNNSKLSGIGTFNFIGCNELILDQNIAGYTLSYRAIHGSDDKIPSEEEIQ